MKKIDFDKFKTTFQEILSGEVFTRDNIRQYYPLIFLIVGLTALYIDCGYRAQRQQRQIAELNRQIEDAHFEYLTVSAQYVEQTRQSVIAKRLEEQGSKIKTSTKPAIQID